MTMPALRDAATILVLRQQQEHLEVFMVKRSKKSAFMPNIYVYPGGALDPKDCDLDAFTLSEGISPEDVQLMFGADIDPAFGIGLLLAGVRETFEEAGLLLARRRDEHHSVDLTQNEPVAQHFAELRTSLHKGELDMLGVTRQEELVLQLGQLEFFSHWITPFFENRRFNARFFVAEAPAHQRPVHDEKETVDSTWINPAEAVESYYRGELSLAPPTLATLMELQDFSTIDEVLAFCRQHRPPVILPHLDQQDDDVVLRFPNDPAFPTDDPQYSMASRGGRWVNMTMRDGLWYPTEQ